MPLKTKKIFLFAERLYEIRKQPDVVVYNFDPSTEPGLHSETVFPKKKQNK
jgi:hypothetical protein